MSLLCRQAAITASRIRFRRERRMTNRDHALLEFAGFVRAHHSIPPTGREFGEILGVGYSAAHARLNTLIRYGYVRHAIDDEGVCRDLYLTPSGEARVARLLDEGAAA